MNLLKNLYFLFLAFLPFSFSLNLFDAIDISIARIIILLFFFSAIYIALIKKNDILLKFIKEKSLLFLLAFISLSFISMLWANNFVFSLRKSLYLINIFLFLAITLIFIQDKKDLKKALDFIFYGAFFVILIGFLQFISQFIFSKEVVYDFWKNNIAYFFYGNLFGEEVLKNNSWFVNVGNDYFRAISIFPNPHHFALYLELIIPFFITYFYHFKKRRGVYFYLFLTLGFIDLLATFSRGAYFAVFASIFILALLIGKNYFKKIFFITSFMLILFFLSPFGERFLYSFLISLDNSSSLRIAIWQKSMDIFLNYPFFGSGFGNLPLFFDPKSNIKSPANAHSTYLEIASELGILGLFLFFGFLFFLFAKLFYLIKLKNKLALGIIIAQVALLTHSIFETFYYSIPVLTLLFFQVAITHKIFYEQRPNS